MTSNGDIRGPGRWKRTSFQGICRSATGACGKLNPSARRYFPSRSACPRALGGTHTAFPDTVPFYRPRPGPAHSSAQRAANGIPGLGRPSHRQATIDHNPRSNPLLLPADKATQPGNRATTPRRSRAVNPVFGRQATRSSAGYFRRQLGGRRPADDFRPANLHFPVQKRNGESACASSAKAAKPFATGATEARRLRLARAAPRRHWLKQSRSDYPYAFFFLHLVEDYIMHKDTVAKRTDAHTTWPCPLSCPCQLRNRGTRQC